jgi:predicted small lipoprotein YifL
LRPFHHSGFRSALALLILAGAVAACGVKGDLEAPPRAGLEGPRAQSSAAAPGDPTAIPEAPRQGAHHSESRVQTGKRLSVEPRMPPEEWSKIGKKDSATKSESSAKARRSRESEPSDRPFVLDWLL